MPVLIATTYVAYLYIALEWLFFATNASFMSSYTPSRELAALLVSPLALLFFAAPAVALAFALERLTPPGELSFRPTLLVPAAMSGCMLLLLADNFAYTIFVWGIISTDELTRWPVLALFGLLLWKCYGWSAELESVVTRRLRVHTRAAAGLVLASTVFGVGELALADRDAASAVVEARSGEPSTPDVIFLAADGIEARWMSAYGYPGETTPFLRRFAEQSLVFENAFSNAGKTTGSTTSMLTGKVPWQVKVGFPPQVLPREDAFQHLPGILRQRGYRGFQRSVRHYADAADLNMQGAFDDANERRLWAPVPGSSAAWLGYAYNSELQLLSRVVERVGRRLLHLTGVEPMVNHFQNLAETQAIGVKWDVPNLEAAVQFIESQQGPYFAHLHLMSTHCCKYNGVRKWFSAELFPELAPSEAEWRARMLSALREADATMEKFVRWLEATGRLERTIIVISSDHTTRWRTTQRIPLMIRFPGGAHAGRASRNAELVDVPATILDAMGLETPAWMNSRSLLDPDPHTTPLEAELALGDHRPILSLDQFNYKRVKLGGLGLSRIESPGPPHYGVKQVSLVLCDRWYRYGLESDELEAGRIQGHTRPCKPEDFPPPAKIYTWMRTALEREGFSLGPSRDTSGAVRRVSLPRKPD